MVRQDLQFKALIPEDAKPNNFKPKLGIQSEHILLCNFKALSSGLARD